MQDLATIYKELAKFRKVTYYDGPHKYLIGDEQLSSTTTLIGQSCEKFQTEEQALAYSVRYNIPVDKVLRTWKFLNVHATTEGSMVHDYIENKIQNKIFPVNWKEVEEAFGWNCIQRTVEIMQKMADEFIDSLPERGLIPIQSELVVCDEEYGIGGMVDQLFWNEKAQELQIWDWKTNTKLSIIEDAFSKYMKGAFCAIMDTEFNKYSIQLSTYRWIIERNTNLVLGKSHIVWFNEKNEAPVILECTDYRREVELQHAEEQLDWEISL